MQLCQVAARHLRDAQATRARHLTECQLIELSQATTNFERGIKMSESRHEMELEHFTVRALPPSRIR